MQYMHTCTCDNTKKCPPPPSSPAIVNEIRRMAGEMLSCVSLVTPEGSLGNTTLDGFPSYSLMLV
jgi:hypothetical protein